MPPGYTDEGLRAAIALRRDYPGLGVLVFSQYIETRYAADLLGTASGRAAAGVGYLLKDRVADVSEFIDALTPGRSRRHRAGPRGRHPAARREPARRTVCRALTTRERDVLALMAEGHSNSCYRREPRSFGAEPSKSTSATSSASSACRRRIPTTGGCSPSCATWNPDRDRHPRPRQAAHWPGHARTDHKSDHATQRRVKVAPRPATCLPGASLTQSAAGGDPMALVVQPELSPVVLAVPEFRVAAQSPRWPHFASIET